MWCSSLGEGGLKLSREFKIGKEMELREIVAEAVNALGYFLPESIDALTTHFERLLPKGFGADILLRERGIIDDLFTSKGQENPRHAAKAIALRVSFNVRRSKQRAAPDFISRCEFRGITNYTCSAGRELTGVVVPLSERTALPLEQCSSEWCACRWDFVLDD
jgi:hypothetical protein